ncbi:MAG: hypothetical protein WC265_06555 [Dysgonamonadaceae bacterium]|jgi:uncharacterized integral membrane protein
MFHHHLFWLAVALFFCSAININAYLEYHKTIRVLPSVIGIVGAFGFIGWLIRLFSLSVMFNWWWFLGVGAASLLFTGIFSYFTQDKISVVIGTLNILLIPLLWWYGSKFNSTATFDWFYDTLNAVQVYFLDV